MSRRSRRSIHAVIFDMDGLMLDTETLAREAWFQTMREFGYPLTDAIYLQVLGTTGARTRRIFQEAFGEDIPVEAMYACKQRYLDEAIDAGRVAVKPGLVALLDQLDSWRVPKAVGSSTARALVLKKLGAAGLVERFDVIVGGDEVAHGKPAPDVFLEAARRLGIAPAGCLVLEDSDNGVRAAHAAGMRVIMVPDLKLPDDNTIPLTYRITPTLADAADLLAELPRMRPN
jgi:HAD superfamily hydrolase (TIGR01509 family)